MKRAQDDKRGFTLIDKVTMNKPLAQLLSQRVAPDFALNEE